MPLSTTAAPSGHHRATMPADVEIGPLLDATRLPALPSTGFNVQYADSDVVVLVGSDGNVIGHLVGFRAPADPPSRVNGPLVLEHDGRIGTVAAHDGVTSWTATGGPPGSFPLDHGARLEPLDGGRRRRLLLRDGKAIVLPWGAIDVSADGRWLTAREVGDTRYVRSTVYDLDTGETIAYDGDCVVADGRGDDTVLACGGELQRRHGAGPAVVVAGRPPGYRDGHWVGAAMSPDASVLLAQYSGECEAPSAWFVPTSGGATAAVARDATIDAVGFAWLSNRAVLAQLGPDVCGKSPPEGAGVYRVERDGTRRRVYSLGTEIGWYATAWTTRPPASP